MKHIVKNKGHSEEYDEKKVYASVFAAVLNCHYNDEDAHAVATNAVKNVNSWMNDQTIVTSADVKNSILEALKDAKVAPDPDIAMMYKHHKDLS